MRSRRGVLTYCAASVMTGAVFGLSGCASGVALTTQGDIHSASAMALGQTLEMQISGGGAQAASRQFRKAFAEAQRLGRVLNPSDPASEVSRLNRQGFLDNPSLDLTQILGIAQILNSATDGGFDFVSAGAAGDVQVSADRIYLSRADMALNLESIAAGFIVDRVIAVLSEQGVSSALVNMGVSKALGVRSDGTSWTVKRGGVERALDAQAPAMSRLFSDRNMKNPYGVSHVSAAYAQGLAVAFMDMPRSAVLELTRQPLWSAVSVTRIGADGRIGPF